MSVLVVKQILHSVVIMDGEILIDVVTTSQYRVQHEVSNFTVIIILWVICPAVLSFTIISDGVAYNKYSPEFVLPSIYYII